MIGEEFEKEYQRIWRLQQEKRCWGPGFHSSFFSRRQTMAMSNMDYPEEEGDGEGATIGLGKSSDYMLNLLGKQFFFLKGLVWSSILVPKYFSWKVFFPKIHYWCIFVPKFGWKSFNEHNPKISLTSCHRQCWQECQSSTLSRIIRKTAGYCGGGFSPYEDDPNPIKIGKNSS